jgi:carboxyl-terminal processing protease
MTFYSGLKKFVYSLFFFCIVVSFCDAKPPSLTPRDTRIKIEEILRAHVSHQKLTPDLVKRALQNYLDEIDPGKTYFIESEIVKWNDPSDELLNKTLLGYKKEDFSTFEEIQEKLTTVISRRGAFEERLQALQALPTKVQASEFKDIKWAQDEEELFNRLVRIKGLQMETAEKIDQQTKETLVQRLNKRRLNREEELIAASPSERKQVVLSLVLKATSSALDSQTTYFTPSEANQFMIQVQQRLFGIGAQLRDDLNGLTIVRLLEGGPAILGNQLKLNDKIIAVNREPIVGMDISEAVELIRGPEGSPVHLTVLRETPVIEGEKLENKIDINITRGEVVLKETRLESSYEPYGDGVIAILHLFSFYQDSKSGSASDLLEALNAIRKDHNVKGVVLDLRNNSGGLLPQAVAVTGLFITKGVVVSVKDNTGQIQHLRNIADGKIPWDGPLVVLTNRTSASAAEIVAQTLQDYGRAIVIGDAETYGKGTFQTFTLEAANYGKVNPKGEYKVTRGRYYTVSGKSPQLVGVKADILVPGVFSELEIGEKYAKFPLENESIDPTFDDDLADIPASHRAQIMRLYKFNLQPIMTTYTPYIPALRKSSQERIEQNPNYQNFLKEISKKELAIEPSEGSGQTDLQLAESLNIMKEFIYLLEEKNLSKTTSPASAKEGDLALLKKAS